MGGYFMKDYTIKTEKTWAQTMREITETFRSWGVDDWNPNYPKGARLEGMRQTEEERTVVITYVKDGKTIVLKMGKQARAVDNLRVLYIALESLRMNERRGIGELLQDAYLQLAAPERIRSPYEILGIYPDSPLAVAEAMYKELAKKSHPDAGGSDEAMRKLNLAIQQIRDEANNR